MLLSESKAKTLFSKKLTIFSLKRDAIQHKQCIHTFVDSLTEIQALVIDHLYG